MRTTSRASARFAEGRPAIAGIPMTPTNNHIFRVLRRLRGKRRAAGLVLLRPGCDEDAVVAKPARWRDRLAARLRSRVLDSQLAAGVPPAASAALSLRAQALGHGPSRTLLGDRIRHVLDEARGAGRITRAQVPVRRSEVLAAAAELEELATRLLAPGPLAARGLAQARLLLTDGASPLYFGGAVEELGAVAARALEALHPSFGW
jgi:hypothetical protein